MYVHFIDDGLANTQGTTKRTYKALCKASGQLKPESYIGSNFCAYLQGFTLFWT